MPGDKRGTVAGDNEFRAEYRLGTKGYLRRVSMLPASSSPPDSQELAVKAAELEVRRLAAAKAMKSLSSPWWLRADPLVLAILAGVLTLLGNMTVAFINNYNSLQQEQKKASDDLGLEQAKARFNLVLQAMATSDAAVAKRNIHFFIDAGLLQVRLQDSQCN
jgi:hypothetical protein